MGLDGTSLRSPPCCGGPLNGCRGRDDGLDPGGGVGWICCDAGCPLDGAAELPFSRGE